MSDFDAASNPQQQTTVNANQQQTSMNVGNVAGPSGIQAQPQAFHQQQQTLNPNAPSGYVQGNNISQVMNLQQHSQQQPRLSVQMGGSWMQPMQSMYTTTNASQQRIATNFGNVGNVGNTRFSNNAILRPPNLQLQQQTLMMTQKNQSTNNPDQQLKILKILKSNTQLMSAFVKQRQAQNQSQSAPGAILQGNVSQNLQLLQSIPNMPTATNANQQQAPTNKGNVEFSNNCIPRPPNLQLQQQTMNITAGMQLGHSAQNIGNQGPKLALQQLKIRSTNNPDQQLKILNILKSNHQRMSAIVKQRQVRPKQALQQLKNQSTNNSDQHLKILNILKSNHKLMTDFIKQRQQAQSQNPNASVFSQVVLQANSSQQQIGIGNAQKSIDTTNAPTTTTQSSVDLTSEDVSSTPSIGNSPPTKEWHNSIKADYRNHIRNELVQAMMPPPDRRKRTYKDSTLEARKIESDVYERANSEAEYHRLIAENIYKLYKEMEEKRQQDE
ncbi:CREB-binding protein-like [Sitodiplosis mosellana]|uniref:CREB-binding protein-like n=1 Tax=Sitodiplosis mosellana TaxID=263140 RepID=UPI0024450F37|nr:CREB-binding protein-like [Sitodiplosis mosellana]